MYVMTKTGAPERRSDKIKSIHNPVVVVSNKANSGKLFISIAKQKATIDPTAIRELM